MSVRTGFVSTAGAVVGCVMACAAGVGCAARQTAANVVDPASLPRELCKTTLPEYVIEPPDVLQVDVITAVPKPPYRIQPLDALGIRATNTLPDAPVAGVYVVDPEGAVALGLDYGSVKVRGMTADEAKAAIEKLLAKVLRNPTVEVSLAQTRAMQLVRGPHLVRPDGAVSLGTYGAVRVVGLTVPAAKRRIEEYLSQYFDAPEISLDIIGFNSKVYYVIYDGGGAGQQVSRLPITGNETVLDAVGQMAGLSVVSDTHRIWVSRPAPAPGPHQVLPVDWTAITQTGDTATNYQLLPGDRIFVQSYPFTRFDTRLARLIAPFERMFGFSLLGAGAVQTLKFQSTNGSNGSNGGIP